MRRLSAIMFTDMVGYSALTQTNEALALRLLEEHRNILRPLFISHNGREIETAGDAFFVEFTSAVEATNCAIEIQTALHERNLLMTDENIIQLRIGLHIGDVVYMDNHVHGDGVNIAARIEPLSPAGGICLSEDVARQIRNKINYPVLPAGKQKLKNIDLPMQIFCIDLPWVNTKHIKRKKKERSFSPLLIISLTLLLLIIITFFILRNYHPAETQATLRLAVLPFTNISNSNNDEYFADGITEEMISTLSKISGLSVIARTSTMKYRETEKDIATIGKELHVNTILQGSVRKFNDQARITVQLIDVATQEHLWSSEFNGDFIDIFKTQTDIAQNVANELKVRIEGSDNKLLRQSKTNNMQAYEEYLRGNHNLNRKTPESIQAALMHYEKAISLDSSFALPYTSLAYCYTLIGVAGYGTLPRNIAEVKAKQAVLAALQLDNTLPEAYATEGYIKFRIDWDWQGAEASFKKALQLKPGYSTAHEWYALFLATQLRLDEALKEIKIAIDLDPLASGVNNGIARIYQFKKETDKALQQVNYTIALDTNYAEAWFTSAMINYQQNNFEKAMPPLIKALKLSNNRPVMQGLLGCIYSKTGKTQEAQTLISELEKKPVTNDKLYAAAMIYNQMGRVEKSMSILQKLVDEKYGIMIYIKADKNFFNGGNGEQYKGLLQQMNLQ